MLTHPNFDPVAVELGPLSIHWYGLMYLFAFGAGWWLGRRRARQSWRGWVPAQVDDLVFYCALGVVLGGRLGYVLFYDTARLLDSPAIVFQVWNGGMSFHGGLIGVLIAMALFARKHRQGFFAISDFVAPLIPLGLGFGRIGNFINGELWGRPSDLPWAMIPPGVSEVARHPSQLYQAALEGVALFLLLWLFSRVPRPQMAVSGLFLLGYGAFRFAVEFVRLPDPHLGYLAWGWLTMGQVLTVPMVVVGSVLLGVAYSRQAKEMTDG